MSFRVDKVQENGIVLFGGGEGVGILKIDTFSSFPPLEVPYLHMPAALVLGDRGMQEMMKTRSVFHFCLHQHLPIV